MYPLDKVMLSGTMAGGPGAHLGETLMPPRGVGVCHPSLTTTQLLGGSQQHSSQQQSHHHHAQALSVMVMPGSAGAASTAFDALDAHHHHHHDQHSGGLLGDLGQRLFCDETLESDESAFLSMDDDTLAGMMQADDTYLYLS